MFADVDECHSTPSPCDVNADCSNRAGGFTCSCRPGFIGDGTRCYNSKYRRVLSASPCLGPCLYTLVMAVSHHAQVRILVQPGPALVRPCVCTPLLVTTACVPMVTLGMGQLMVEVVWWMVMDVA